MFCCWKSMSIVIWYRCLHTFRSDPLYGLFILCNFAVVPKKKQLYIQWLKITLFILKKFVCLRLAMSLSWNLNMRSADDFWINTGDCVGRHRKWCFHDKFIFLSKADELKLPLCVLSMVDFPLVYNVELLLVLWISDIIIKKHKIKICR